ncbi:MAG: hypothetical protein JOY71_13960 [Acetobacteraceae bacterium]|nr:hypothetical protein [Acetobacteraceae bacterium]
MHRAPQIGETNGSNPGRDHSGLNPGRRAFHGLQTAALLGKPRAHFGAKFGHLRTKFANRVGELCFAAGFRELDTQLGHLVPWIGICHCWLLGTLGSPSLGLPSVSYPLTLYRDPSVKDSWSRHLSVPTAEIGFA